MGRGQGRALLQADEIQQRSLLLQRHQQIKVAPRGTLPLRQGAEDAHVACPVTCRQFEDLLAMLLYQPASHRRLL